MVKVSPSPDAKKNNKRQQAQRMTVVNHKWGSPHNPPVPPLHHKSLHYPASETPVATMLGGVTPVTNSSWRNVTPPAAPSLSVFSSSHFPTTSAPSSRSPPRTQPKKTSASTRRSRTWKRDNSTDVRPFYSQVAASSSLTRLSGGAKPPQPRPSRMLHAKQQQQQQQNAAIASHAKQQLQKSAVASAAAAAAAARSDARWRKNRTARGGRVAKKTAPRTRRLTTTTRKKGGMPPRAPNNSTQMLMHLYNMATMKKKNNNRNRNSNNGKNDVLRPLSSLASPRVDGTPVRFGGAASIGMLLHGHIDTFGTLLKSPRLPPRPPLPRRRRDDTFITPPFSPIDDMDTIDIDTFGSNLDDRDGGDWSTGGCDYAARLPSDVFGHRHHHRGGGEGVGGGECTPVLRRSFSNFSDATNSTWLGDDVEEEEQQKEEEEEEKKEEGYITPSFLTSPVAWTPASPHPQHRR